MASAVYLLCALASSFCAVLLVRSYARTRTRLLLWSSLCFIGLTISNILLFVDLVIVPEIDLSLARSGTAFASIVLLVIGLVWEDA
jgi:hypothetical protein